MLAGLDALRKLRPAAVPWASVYRSRARKFTYDRPVENMERSCSRLFGILQHLLVSAELYCALGTLASAAVGRRVGRKRPSPTHVLNQSQ